MMMPPPPVPSGPVHGVAWVDALEAEKKELQAKERELEAQKKELQAKENKLQAEEDKLQKLLVKVGKVWEAGAQLADIEGKVNDFGIFGGVEDVFWELKSKLAEVKQEKAYVTDQLKTTSAYLSRAYADRVSVWKNEAVESAAKRMRLTSEPSSTNRIVRSHSLQAGGGPVHARPDTSRLVLGSVGKPCVERTESCRRRGGDRGRAADSLQREIVQAGGERDVG